MHFHQRKTDLQYTLLTNSPPAVKYTGLEKIIPEDDATLRDIQPVGTENDAISRIPGSLREISETKLRRISAVSHKLNQM